MSKGKLIPQHLERYQGDLFMKTALVYMVCLLGLFIQSRAFAKENRELTKEEAAAKFYCSTHRYTQYQSSCELGFLLSSTNNNDVALKNCDSSYNSSAIDIPKKGGLSGAAARNSILFIQEENAACKSGVAYYQLWIQKDSK